MLLSMSDNKVEKKWRNRSLIRSKHILNRGYITFALIFECRKRLANNCGARLFDIHLRNLENNHFHIFG